MEKKIKKIFHVLRVYFHCFTCSHFLRCRIKFCPKSGEIYRFVGMTKETKMIILGPHHCEKPIE